MPEKEWLLFRHRPPLWLPHSTTDDSDGPTPERFWKVRRGAPSSAADGQCRGERIAPLRHATISGGFSAGFARVLAVGHGQDAGEGCRREKEWKLRGMAHSAMPRGSFFSECGSQSGGLCLKRMASFQA